MECTKEQLFDNSITFFQPKSGYRYNIDSFLLAHFRPNSFKNILDLGTGSGILMFLLHHQNPRSHIVGIEKQKELYDCAAENIFFNKKESHLHIIHEDIINFKNIDLKPQSFEMIISNPPFGNDGDGKKNPDIKKKIARHFENISFEDWVKAAAYFLIPSGVFRIITRVSSFIEYSNVLRKHHFEPKYLRFIHSFIYSEAHTVLIEARRSAKTGVKILSPLIIYKTEKIYTDEVEKIFCFRLNTFKKL